jgi:cyclase
VLIVEGHFRPAAAALEIEAARAISKAPIRGAIDTHYHLDHTFGNSGYAEQHIPILGHERVPILMKERYAALKGVDKSPQVARLEHKIAETLDAARKQHLESDLRATKWMNDGIDAVTLAYPTETFAAQDLPKKIDLGGLTAVIEFHLGHTPTDLIVKVPERDVVFTGDLLFEHKYPVSIDADMMAWRKVLDVFARYPRRTKFVPGHGPVCGIEVVREQQDVFDDLRAHAGKMKKDGATVEEATRRYVVPQRFRDLEIFAWGWTIGAAVESFFAGIG